MLPSLSPGDLIRVEAVDDVRVGDVVAFESSDGWVITHRVVRLVSHGLVCRGDNRVLADGVIDRDAVIGRAKTVVSPQGRVLRPVRAGRRALAVARLRRLGLIGRARVRHLLAEAALLGRQWRSPSAGASSASDVVAALDASGRVPAATYSRLAHPERRLLLARLLGETPETLVVEAFALTSSHRVARTLGRLRAVLRRLGVEAGQPGDTALPPEPGLPSGLLHLFRADELRAELEDAGAAVTRIDSRPGPPEVLVARVTTSARRVRSSSGTR